MTVAVFTAIGSFISDKVNAIVAWVRDFATRFVQLHVDAFNRARAAVSSGVSAVVGFVRALPGRILGALSGLGSLLVTSGRALLQGLWRGISGAVGWIKGKISGVLSSIRNLFPFSPAKEGPFSGSGYTDHSGRALITDFARAIAADGAGAVSAAERVAGQVRSALSPGTLGATIAAPPRVAYASAPAADAFDGTSGGMAGHRPIGVAELRDALAGMTLTLDESGGRVLARVVNRRNAADRRR